MGRLEIRNIDAQRFNQLCNKATPSPLARDETYHVTYKHFINLLSGLKELNENSLLVASSLAYSWMPTAISLTPSDLTRSLDSIRHIVEHPEYISTDSLENAAAFLGGSYIGLSKALHFLRPNMFPIYDTAIFCFIYEKQSRPAYVTVNRRERVVQYFKDVWDLSKDQKVVERVNSEVIQEVIKLYGYEVSVVRALELSMFARSPIRK